MELDYFHVLSFDCSGLVSIFALLTIKSSTLATKMQHEMDHFLFPEDFLHQTQSDGQWVTLP